MRAGGFERLLIPALRADQNGGFEGSRDLIDEALRAGVGGFILFGGEAASVSRLIAELREASAHPLLICSDLERGSGQQFEGATRLPPAAAIAHLEDLEVTRRAGEVTAREARSIGIDCILAPVADIDSEPKNPIVGTRAFGRTPEEVSRQVIEWTRGCLQGGCLACAKHFPGHGRTVSDSHLTLPRDDADSAQIERDMAPFRALIDEGVPAVMTAHVAYPALDRDGSPATLSAPVLTELLRKRLGFDGLVITDGLGMTGLTGTISEGAAAVGALIAGCDLLLYPTRVDEVAEALSNAIDSGSLPVEVVRASLRRLDAALSKLDAGAAGGWGRPEDRRWASEVARRSLLSLRGDPHLSGSRVRLIEIDDDTLASSAPARRALAEILIAEAFDLGSSGQPLIALYADVHAGKDGPGLSVDAIAQVESELATSPEAVVVLFGHPRMAQQLPIAQHLLCAWGGERLMQEAAARQLRSSR